MKLGFLDTLLGFSDAASLRAASSSVRHLAAWSGLPDAS